MSTHWARQPTNAAAFGCSGPTDTNRCWCRLSNSMPLDTCRITRLCFNSWRSWRGTPEFFLILSRAVATVQMIALPVQLVRIGRVCLQPGNAGHLMMAAEGNLLL